MSLNRGLARYAVIFVSQRSDADDDYEATDRRLLEMVRQQPGFAGLESISDGRRGITISYWHSLESIRAWRDVEEHRQAQQRGRSDWYRSYRVQVCRIERDYAFEADS